MKHLAPTHWPKGTRRGYCWLPPGSNSKCVMKVGFNDDDADGDGGGDDDDNKFYHISLLTLLVARFFLSLKSAH